jgi:ATP-dependent protease HslVU (ClpYQ) peptidase subunit
VTTIAYRNHVIAADSRETVDSDAGGTTIGQCEKLFRKRVGKRDIVIGTAGGSYLGMVFVDWFDGTAKEPPSILRDAHLDEDFDVLILDRGKVYTANHLCRPIEVVSPFTAIGSGRKAALAAMHCGRGAREAVAIACKVDPFSAPPIVTMTMPGAR